MSGVSVNVIESLFLNRLATASWSCHSGPWCDAKHEPLCREWCREDANTESVNRRADNVRGRPSA